MNGANGRGLLYAALTGPPFDGGGLVSLQLRPTDYATVWAET